MDAIAQKRLQIVVVGAVTLLFTLVLVLVLIMSMNHTRLSRADALAMENARLEQQLRNIQNELEYMDTWQFILDYARDELGLGRPGQNHWTQQQ
ncbi:MAG: hypothetical protein FWE38_00725 [Firmicutes bacterium]|nr:hypothetical protein [Bacillota bacterium]